MKSAMTERAPMQSPPNAAAVGMYLKEDNGHSNGYTAKRYSKMLIKKELVRMQLAKFRCKCIKL